MGYKIKKGDKFLCIQNYINYESEICFHKNSEYESLLNGTLPSSIDEFHVMEDAEDFWDYFKQISGNISTNTVNVSNTEPELAMRFNIGKPEYSLLHLPSLEPCVKVLTFGKNKYSRDNWLRGFQFTSILDSMLRHVAALQRGEFIDPETNESHIGAIQCNAMFLGNKNNTMDLEDLKDEFKKWKQS